MKGTGFAVVDPKCKKKDRYLKDTWGAFGDDLIYEVGNPYNTISKAKGPASSKLQGSITRAKATIASLKDQLTLPKKDRWRAIKEIKVEIQKEESELRKLERCVIEEVPWEFPDKKKKALIDFNGSKKFELVEATTNRRRCGRCGGTIFKDHIHLLAEVPGQYTVSLCVFCIAALSSIAEHQIKIMPPSLREEFERGHGGFAKELSKLI